MSGGTVTCTRAELVACFGEPTYLAGELRGHLETYGPWGIPLRYTAPAVTIEDGPTRDWERYAPVAAYTVHGLRTGYAPKEEGYHLEGRVSVKGEKRSAFTSSVLFAVSDPLPGEPRHFEAACWRCRAGKGEA
jgi:hypothetical protein